MRHQNQNISTTTVILLFAVLLLALFPSVFHYFWTLPLGLLGFSRSSSSHYSSSYGSMSWFQKQFTLPAKSRGSYLITDQVVAALPELREYKVGLLNLFIQHTSCAISLNENCMRYSPHQTVSCGQAKR